jgi:hypothetical protein
MVLGLCLHHSIGVLCKTIVNFDDISDLGTKKTGEVFLA